MDVKMTNRNTKRFLVRETALRVFGDDFDYRRKEMGDEEAEKRFDTAWADSLQEKAIKGDLLPLDVVRKHVTGTPGGYIKVDAEHKHFRIENKYFIAQFPSDSECDQLWPIASAIKDPWTIYVKFAEVAIVERIETESQKIGWTPEQLAEKLMLEFLETVTHETFERLYLRKK
ncbi:MAG TPA: hypothetical protein VHY91_05385 [Pirellulales bacterium]|jgi:hypothetical protein|nr:hypothetical protein [Pirellulales bacterium]